MLSQTGCGGFHSEEDENSKRQSHAQKNKKVSDLTLETSQYCDALFIAGLGESIVYRGYYFKRKKKNNFVCSCFHV